MNYERLLRRIRNHPALYGDLGERKEKQAERIRDKCKVKLAPVFKKRADHSQTLRDERMLRMWA